MISVDDIIDLTISNLKKSFPDALKDGFLISNNSSFNPSSNTVTDSKTQVAVYIVSESLTSQEIQASNLLNNDLKIHVLSDQVLDISFYQKVVFNSIEYKIFMKTDYLIGFQRCLWTLICRK